MRAYRFREAFFGFLFGFNQFLLVRARVSRFQPYVPSIYFWVDGFKTFLDKISIRKIVAFLYFFGPFTL